MTKNTLDAQAFVNKLHTLAIEAMHMFENDFVYEYEADLEIYVNDISEYERDIEKCNCSTIQEHHAVYEALGEYKSVMKLLKKAIVEASVDNNRIERALKHILDYAKDNTDHVICDYYYMKEHFEKYPVKGFWASNQMLWNEIVSLYKEKSEPRYFIFR